MGVFLKIISVLVIAAAIALPIVINQQRKASSWRSGRDSDGTYKKVSRMYTVVPVLFGVFLFAISSSFVIIPHWLYRCSFNLWTN